MATDLKGSYFKLLSVSLKVGHFSHVQGGTARFLAGQHDLDFRSRVAISSPVSFLHLLSAQPPD